MELTKTNFEAKVIRNRSLTLVKFKAEWSGACQIIMPIYQELARSYKGTAHFFSVDLESGQSLHQEFGIKELPTILFFNKGRVVDHVAGLVSKNTLITKIETVLTASEN